MNCTCPHCGGQIGLTDVADQIQGQLPDQPLRSVSGHAGGIHLVDTRAGARPTSPAWAQAWDEYDQALAGLEDKLAEVAELVRMSKL